MIVGELIDEVITNIGNTGVYDSVKKKVADLCGGFPLYSEMT